LYIRSLLWRDSEEFLPISQYIFLYLRSNSSLFFLTWHSLRGKNVHYTVYTGLPTFLYLRHIFQLNVTMFQLSKTFHTVYVRRMFITLFILVIQKIPHSLREKNVHYTVYIGLPTLLYWGRFFILTSPQKWRRRRRRRRRKRKEEEEDNDDGDDDDDDDDDNVKVMRRQLFRRKKMSFSGLTESR
jgi:hypothetical protein